MLIEFRVKNFRSYKEEQVFSLVASKDEKLSDENTFLVEGSGSLRLNRSAGIYGANASGKSNLVHAFTFMGLFIQTSFQIEPKLSEILRPFAFNDLTADEPAEFEISFIHNGIRYQYGFSISNEHAPIVHEEWLLAFPNRRAQTWFTRTLADKSNEEYNWYFGPSLKGQNAQLSGATRSSRLYMTVATELNHKQLMNVYKYFEHSLRVVEHPISDRDKVRDTVRAIKQNPTFAESIRKLLLVADLGIKDFEIREKPIHINDPSGELAWLPTALDAVGESPRKIEIQFQHESEQNGHVDTSLHISQESQGTREFFGIIGYILEVLNDGGFLVIDELDTSIHPLLVEALVKLFHNPITNPQNAQLIFNTHDVTLLDLTLFRRDQIWFTEKNRNGETALYSLLEYKPRNDEAIIKGYLSGRYGAVPFIDSHVELSVNGSS